MEEILVEKKKRRGQCSEKILSIFKTRNKQQSYFVLLSTSLQ
jgi:hypothetical protein